MKKLLLSIILLANAFAVFAQTPPAANHNVGCSADAGQSGGDALTNVSNIKTVLPAGDRTSNVGSATQAAWYGVSAISKEKDAANNDIYKFVLSLNGASGGFDFGNSLDITESNYVHVAVYAETGDQTITIRLATPGGMDGTYTQHQIDSKAQALKQGWNYLNLRLSDFDYVGNNGVTDYRVATVKQIGFVFSTGGKTLYVDDIYFYTLPIVAANHNIGCSASTGDGSVAIKGATNIQTILSAGDRTSKFDNFENQIWDGASSKATIQDADDHTIYKFTPANNYGNGGFYFAPTLDASWYDTYLHAALYVENETHTQIRLATPGGGTDSNGKSTYSHYEVNTTVLDLKPGWNYLNLPIIVHNEDRSVTGIQDGFAYWECDNNFNFDPARVQQIGFVISEANHSIYADDIYFYNMPYSTVDDDDENINWNTESGTSCWVDKMVRVEGQRTEEEQNGLQNAADGKNDTYLGISRGDAATYFTSADNAYYAVAQLARPITVSDVEMVWGNGYPLHYEVYALTSAPAVWNKENIDNALTADKRLFAFDTEVVTYEPYFNTTSELDKQGNQNNDTRYVVVKMWQPMGNTFGFKLNEIHVGAFDNDYYTADHIDVPNLNFRTEKENQQTITPTARNKRNAILSSRAITSINYNIEGNQSRYITINRDGDNANVWASMPGTYTMDITGTVDGKTLPNAGHCTMKVSRDWLSESTNTPSMIQKLNESDFSATITQTNDAAEGEFAIKNIMDGKEDTRWASGSTQATAENQYIAIKLGDDNQEYKIRDLEFLWERAYPAKYAVYGFYDMPDTAKVTYDAFKTAHASRLLYETTLNQGINDFPYHDLHVLGTGNGNVKEYNDTRYLVVAFSEPIQQLNGNMYGVSIWELYAQGTNMTEFNHTQAIHADDMKLYINRKENFTVESQDETGKVIVDKLNDATFAGAAENTERSLRATSSTVANNVYTLTSTIDGENVEVAEIWDAGNNTYALRTGSDKRIAGKSFNITVNYNKDGKNLTTTFALTVIKKPMDLAPNSTETNLVFDDGYYVEQRLERYASLKVRTVDLTNVDFTSDYAGKRLDNVEIPAPRWLNYNQTTGEKKGEDNSQIGVDMAGNAITANLKVADRDDMNPNAIYYVNQDAFNGTTLKESSARVHGENVALKDNSGSAANDWYIDNLRVFDGYDFAPEAPTANTENITARRARFYTNIPAEKKTTLVFPFNVSRTGFDDVKFYLPTALKMNDDNGEITLTEDKGSTAINGNIYIVESASSRVDSNNGFAVAFQSDHYGDVDNRVTVLKEGPSKALAVDGTSSVATLESSYVKQTLNNDGENKYYLYSANSGSFLPANDEWFDYKSNPTNADKSFRGNDYRNTLLQFYACLKVPNTAPSAAKVSWWIQEGTATGITDIDENSVDGLDVNAPMYDVLGRRVNSSYRGIVIQNGKKYVRN